MEGNENLWLRRTQADRSNGHCQDKETASFRGRMHVVVEDRIEYKLYRVRVHK